MDETPCCTDSDACRVSRTPRRRPGVGAGSPLAAFLRLARLRQAGHLRFGALAGRETPADRAGEDGDDDDGGGPP